MKPPLLLKSCCVELSWLAPLFSNPTIGTKIISKKDKINYGSNEFCNYCKSTLHVARKGSQKHCKNNCFRELFVIISAGMVVCSSQFLLHLAMLDQSVQLLLPSTTSFGILSWVFFSLSTHPFPGNSLPQNPLFLGPQNYSF